MKTMLVLMAISYFAYDKFMLRGTPEPVPEKAATQMVAEQVAGEVVSETEKSIAVLPFVDMSPEKDQEYFTDGLTENLLNALAKMRDLKVAGRTSSFAFKNRNEDLRSIGEQLGVANLLEGSVQKSGQRIRITAQLISVGDGYHLWSETYDRTLEDIFAVQDEIAGEVARAMQVALLGGGDLTESSAASPNAGVAYNDYLKGLYERNQGSMESNERAVVYYRRALKEDPNMALAWAGLARSLDYITGYGDGGFTAGFEEARVSALQTLISTTGESASYQIANVYAQWGDADNAMSWLERGYKIRDPGLQYINMATQFDPISADPRFQAFLRKMNF